MATDKCLFLVAAEHIESALPVVTKRAEALERFYSQVAPARLKLRAWNPAGVIAGVVEVGGQDAGEVSDFELWGEPLYRLRDSQAILSASAEELRAEVGSFMAIAVGGQRARLITAAAGPTTAYAAHGRDCAVWSSHAVAAGWVANGRVQVDMPNLAEHVAFDFVGGDRTFVAGVRAVGPATIIDLEPGDATKSSYWPPGQRWALAPEPTAREAAEAALLETLEIRVSGPQVPKLALTAGADSRVLAIALDELGVEIDAFTWGEPDWPDVKGAQRVARALGGRHSVESSRFLDAQGVLDNLDVLARWCDGVTALSYGLRSWPGPADAWLTGAGGETGRAFYWRGWEASCPHPRPDDYLDALSPVDRLGPAEEETTLALRGRAREWVAQSLEIGLTGWRVLDVLYAEQRVRRWGRSQMPPLSGSLVGGFTPAPLARALTSMPVADRVLDAFANRFVLSRAPQLALPEPQRRTVWSRAKRRLRSRNPCPPAPDPLLAELLAGRPIVRAFVRDMLSQPAVTDGLGRDWSDQTLAGLDAADRRSTERAFTICGPLALADAIEADLRPVD